MATHPTRHLSPLLATGIIAVPALFTWALLTRGYAPSTRRAAFFYLSVNIALGIGGEIARS